MECTKSCDGFYVKVIRRIISHNSFIALWSSYPRLAMFESPEISTVFLERGAGNEILECSESGIRIRFF